MFYEFDFFQPLDFLDFSREIHTNCSSFNSMPSAIKRTVLNRIYYALFLYIRQWLIKFDGYVSTKDDHTNIPEYIHNHNHNLFSPLDSQFIASHFVILKKLRQQSDYYITKSDCLRYGEIWVSNDIDFAFETANQIIDKFENKHHLVV